jgi:hypothetical protein
MSVTSDPHSGVSAAERRGRVRTLAEQHPLYVSAAG